MPNLQGKRWVFTLNNPTQVEKGIFADLLNNERVIYAVVGNETGEEGTPHLQGFVIFRRNVRFNRLRTDFGGRVHWELARGSNDEASNYCKKDGDYAEYGQLPPSQRGRRTDLESLVQWVDDFTTSNGRAPISPDFALNQPSAYIRYPRATRMAAHRAPPRQLQLGEPREWQTELEETLLGEADDRTVHFYVDEAGGQGKTWFQRYMFTKYPSKVQLLSIGRRDDLAMLIDETKCIFLFNVPRHQMDFLRYEILEQLKDRIVQSNKYQTTLKTFVSNVHVVVFSNEFPDETKLSLDRYHTVGL